MPRIHAISQIVGNFADLLPETITEERYKLFDDLSAFYIKGRYTSYKEKISALLNEQEVKIVLEKTKEVFAWLLTLKP
ncbi:MAG: HEPN domain-containing protein [Clostridiales bacterium]|nr:HEPN domain-containing protein [Clostridiales bacterium]